MGKFKKFVTRPLIELKGRTKAQNDRTDVTNKTADSNATKNAQDARKNARNATQFFQKSVKTSQRNNSRTKQARNSNFAPLDAHKKVDII